MHETRGNHPSDRELADFGAGKLPDEQAARIAAHLTACGDCSARMEQLPPDSFVSKLKAAAPHGSTATPPLSPAGGEKDLPRTQHAAAAGAPAELTSSRKFEILGKLGEGGMGSVWKARHTFLGKPVAIKVMNATIGANPEARARFLREMQATAKLRHPHIVQALDAEALGEHLILVMEYVEGITLDKLVAQKGPFPAGFACRFVSEAAEGLQHAFELGMVHRDIKPANLMVTKETKQIKVLDFGLARGPRDPGGRGNQTRAQTFLGTPEYVAPEQATDARNADIRADIYSLGCTLYFLLAGRPPFQRANALETIVAHVQDEATPLEQLRSDLPAGLAVAVAKMIAKDPKDRYQTPGEVAEALKPFTVAEPIVSPPRRRSQARGAKGKRRWGVLASAILAGLLTMSLAAWGVLSRAVDGKAEVEKPPARRERVEGETTEERFAPMFNGQDTRGWQLLGSGTTKISIRGGVLTLKNDGPANSDDDLVTARADYRNFHLRYQVKHEDPAGAKVRFRVDPSRAARGGMRGYLVIVKGADPRGEQKDGGVSLHLSARRRQELKLKWHPVPHLLAGEWAKVEVIAVGERVRVSIDGQLVLEYQDEGRTFLRGGVSLFCGAGATAHFRDLVIKQLPDTPEPAGDRLRWVHRETIDPTNEWWGVFQRVKGNRWIESVTHYGGFLRYEFREIDRTKEYVELERLLNGKPLYIRLFPGRADLGGDRTRLRTSRYEGGWVRADSPAAPLEGAPDLGATTPGK
jgi:hypothetical protein